VSLEPCVREQNLSLNRAFSVRRELVLERKPILLTLNNSANNKWYQSTDLATMAEGTRVSQLAESLAKLRDDYTEFKTSTIAFQTSTVAA
jgi:hypothetical protein